MPNIDDTNQPTLSADTLQQFPVREVAIILRGLALDTIKRLLSENQPSTRPSLAHMLSQQPIRPVWEKATANPLSREKWTSAPIQPGAKGAEDQSPFSSALRQGGSVNPNAQETGLIKQELAQLELAGFEILPKPYWPFAANTAWLSPAVQADFSYLVQRHLRNYVFIKHDDATYPTFSTPAFWGLILLLDTNSRPAPQASKYTGSKQNENPDDSPVMLSRISYALRNIALEETLKPAWAGFWDQWLLSHAVATWMPPTSKDNIDILREILDFPVNKVLNPGVKEKYGQQIQWQKQDSKHLGRPLRPSEKPAWYAANTSSHK